MDGQSLQSHLNDRGTQGFVTKTNSPGTQTFGTQVNTSGGTFVAGNVITSGDFVGRDQYIGYTVEQVSTLLSQVSTTYQPKPFDGRCPYVGLDAFDERDADRYFGREKLVADLVARVKDTRFVVIAGPSGSGKSSLLRAGLIYQLKQGILPGSDRWLYESLKPGRNPLDELARVAASLASTLNAGDDIRTKGTTEPTVLHQWIEIALKDDRSRHAVILVDQFEELFTQVTNEAERIAFLNLLTYTATVEKGRVTVLFTLRSDFVSDCATYPQLNALLNQQFIQVGAMQPDELVNAIALPALQVGLRIDPDLIAQIVNDMRDEPGVLPLMQFALKDLFDAQQTKGGVIALTRADYLARGGLYKSLERHADNAFKQLTEPEQQLARTVFIGLIQIGRGAQDTRRTATFDELAPASTDPVRVQAVVQKLANARLITTDERGDKNTVTLAHERLIEAWPWLQKLVNENREAITLQNQISEDATEWNTKQRDPSYLYTGARLETVREQLAAHRLILSGLVLRFVEASIQAHEAERLRRQKTTRNLIISLTVLALVLAGMGIVAVLSRQQAVESAAKAVSASGIAEARRIEAEQARNEAQTQAKISRSRELATAALSQVDVNPERAILLAIEANKVSGTFEAEDALRQAVSISRVRAALRGQATALFSAHFSPDGKTLLLLGNTPDLELWDIETAWLKYRLVGHTDQVQSAEFSPDGKLILTTSRDDTARLWDTTSGQELAQFGAGGEPVLAAQFSPDGAHILIGSGKGNTNMAISSGARFSVGPNSSGAMEADPSMGLEAFQDASSYLTATVWNIATRQQMFGLRGHDGAIVEARFSPDGKQIITAGADGTARVWDANTGKQHLKLVGADTPTPIFRALFSPDGKTIVTVDGHGNVQAWVAETGESRVYLDPNTGAEHTQLSVLGEPAGVPFDALFSPDGESILTLNNFSTSRLWDLNSGRERFTLTGHRGGIWDVQFSPDGASIASTGGDGTIRLWNSTNGEEQVVLRGHSNMVSSVRFFADGSYLISTDIDGYARIWVNETDIEQALLPGASFSSTTEQFSPDGKFILRSIEVPDRRAVIKIWDTGTGKEHAMLTATGSLSQGYYSPDGKLILALDSAGEIHIWDAISLRKLFVIDGTNGEFSPNSAFILTLTNDKTVTVWEVKTHAMSQILREPNIKILSAHFSPDGQSILTLHENGEAGIWNMDTGKKVAAFLKHKAAINEAHFSSNGQTVLTAASDGTVRVWDAMSGNELKLLYNNEKSPAVAQFSPDDSHILVETGTEVILYDMRAFQEVGTLPGHLATFSVDGKRIVTVNTDATAIIWNTESGQSVATLRGHTDILWNAQFSPDGKSVLTASSDGTARLWDASTGSPITIWRSTNVGNFSRMLISPDSKQMLAMNDSGRARLYLVNGKDVMNLATTRVMRLLTCEERQQFLRETTVCPTP